MKTPETNHLIRFPDCDPFNHLNNSRYIDYFINAREDHLSQFYNFKIYQYAKETGKSWVVSQNQISYLAPANLMENVVIQSTILEMNASDILVEMRMWDEQKIKLKSLLWTKFVHIDLRDLKRIEHDKFLTDKFLQYINPLENKMTFEERVNDIRKKKYIEI